MKDSGVEWIGDIPKSWNSIKTKNKYRFKKEIVNDRVNQYERLSLTLNGVLKRSKDDSNGLQPEKFEGYQILNKNELVFKLIDLENVNTSRVGLSLFTGLVSPAYIVLNNEIEAPYGYFYYYSMWQREVFNHIGGDGVRSALNKGDLLKIPYLDVPQEEQIKIVNYLQININKINSLIRKTKSTIDDYKLLKQAIITETVTKGLDKNVEMKDSGIEWIGEIPTGWDTLMLAQVFAQVKNKNKDIQETNLLSLSYGNIVKRNIETTDGLLPESFDGYNIIEDGDIVLRLTDLQNDHTSLRVGLSKERGIITSAYITLRKKINVNEKYLYYFLHSFDVFKGFYGMGAGVRQGLNFSGLKKLKIAIPTIDEQQQIVNHIEIRASKIENLINQKEKLLIDLEMFKKSLIYEYVTGKKEVE
ncbi:type I restriction enzyme, S subunit [Proteiniclasticum ruminis]|uniref:Type I restriction enzyme, S subunit n=2 Tax=Proteiniclasticum ruminis TaxID=398199 RepID=A0A1G8I688_9CLOT|nr:type I restriction enzyme, S subunit [Proteiniclasticum ruminis]